MVHPRNTPAWRQEHRLRQLYDMTTADFDRLYDSQQGRCRLCREPITKTKTESTRRHACIDHDHITHRVRGLLCQPCNMFLGMFESRQHLLPHIVAYLANSVLS